MTRYEVEVETKCNLWGKPAAVQLDRCYLAREIFARHILKAWKYLRVLVLRLYLEYPLLF
jgi:hypothetical protein